MIPINQRIVKQGSGDCMRVAVASLLELPYGHVWDFMAIGAATGTPARPSGSWFIALWEFLAAYGFEFYGTGYPNEDKTPPDLYKSPHYKGHIIASVPSRTHEGGKHSIIIDLAGQCVHDPNPNKRWQGALIVPNILDYWIFHV